MTPSWLPIFSTFSYNGCLETSLSVRAFTNEDENGTETFTDSDKSDHGPPKGKKNNLQFTNMNANDNRESAATKAQVAGPRNFIGAVRRERLPEVPKESLQIRIYRARRRVKHRLFLNASLAGFLPSLGQWVRSWPRSLREQTFLRALENASHGPFFSKNRMKCVPFNTSLTEQH